MCPGHHPGWQASCWVSVSQGHATQALALVSSALPTPGLLPVWVCGGVGGTEEVGVGLTSSTQRVLAQRLHFPCPAWPSAHPVILRQWFSFSTVPPASFPLPQPQPQSAASARVSSGALSHLGSPCPIPWGPWRQAAAKHLQEKGSSRAATPPPPGPCLQTGSIVGAASGPPATPFIALYRHHVSAGVTPSVPRGLSRLLHPAQGPWAEGTTHTPCPQEGSPVPLLPPRHL